MSETSHPQAWSLGEMPLHRLISAGRKVTRDQCSREVRLAVIGDGATQHYCQALAAACKLRGFWPDLYEAEYDTFHQEILSSTSEMYAHRPEFVVLFPTVQALWTKFCRAESKPGFAQLVSDEYQIFWDSIRANLTATIVHHNLALPLNRPYGNSTPVCSDTFVHTVSDINRGLLDAAAAGTIKLVDTEFQSAFHGKRHWFDERLWCQARQGLSPAFLPSIAKSVSDTILGELGVGLKCVVVDLDNTLWGGILADDGPDALEIGQTEVGLVFSRFQLLLSELKARGILLAVCSKNHQESVESVLDKHPDLMLRRSDFAVVVANFGDKVTNIRAIREQLNIGFESMAFLDDTPFERNFVRSAIPSLQVPELPEDPADFLRCLAGWNLFEGRSATAEDLARSSYYQNNAARDQIRASCSNLEEFIENLQMQAEILPLSSYTLPRAHQLVQRSNQFNLTTIRYSEAELATMSSDPSIAAFSIRLLDRLGDNGIIAFVILRKRGSDAWVDTWIMSCRVLGRRVEDLTLLMIVEHAKSLGCDTIIGQYAPTAKNGMVAQLYPNLGFRAKGQDVDMQQFELECDGFERKAFPIQIHRQEMVH